MLRTSYMNKRSVAQLLIPVVNVIGGRSEKQNNNDIHQSQPNTNGNSSNGNGAEKSPEEVSPRAATPLRANAPAVAQPRRPRRLRICDIHHLSLTLLCACI
jgi:hypothetical protein